MGLNPVCSRCGRPLAEGILVVEQPVCPRCVVVEMPAEPVPVVEDVSTNPFTMVVPIDAPNEVIDRDVQSDARTGRHVSRGLFLMRAGYLVAAAAIAVHWFSLLFASTPAVSAPRPEQAHLWPMILIVCIGVPLLLAGGLLLLGRLECSWAPGERMRYAALGAGIALAGFLLLGLWYVLVLRETSPVSVTLLVVLTWLVALLGSCGEGMFLWFVHDLGKSLRAVEVSRGAGWCGVLIGILVAVALVLWCCSDASPFMLWLRPSVQSTQGESYYDPGFVEGPTVRGQLLLLARMAEFMAFLVLLKHADLARSARRSLTGWLMVREAARLL